MRTPESFSPYESPETVEDLSALEHQATKVLDQLSPTERERAVREAIPETSGEQLVLDVESKTHFTTSLPETKRVMRYIGFPPAAYPRRRDI